MNKIKQFFLKVKSIFLSIFWNWLSDKIKIKLIDAFHVFASAFAFALSVSIIQLDHIEWKASFFMSLIIAAIGAAVKEVVMKITPVRLGGKKA